MLSASIYALILVLAVSCDERQRATTSAVLVKTAISSRNIGGLESYMLGRQENRGELVGFTRDKIGSVDYYWLEESVTIAGVPCKRSIGLHFLNGSLFRVDFTYIPVKETDTSELRSRLRTSLQGEYHPDVPVDHGKRIGERVLEVRDKDGDSLYLSFMEKGASISVQLSPE